MNPTSHTSTLLTGIHREIIVPAKYLLKMAAKAGLMIGILLATSMPLTIYSLWVARSVEPTNHAAASAGHTLILINLILLAVGGLVGVFQVATSRDTSSPIHWWRIMAAWIFGNLLLTAQIAWITKL